MQEGSRSTVVLFDFYGKRIKVGALEWAPLRVIQAETKFDALHLQVDKDFLSSVQVPHLDAYGSGEEADEEEDMPGGNEPPAEELPEPKGGDQLDLDVTAAGNMEENEEKQEELTLSQELGHQMVVEGYVDEDDVAEGYIPTEVCDYLVEIGPDDPVGISVHFDEDGNLVANCNEVELVDELGDSADPQKENGSESS